MMKYKLKSHLTSIFTFTLAMATVYFLFKEEVWASLLTAVLGIGYLHTEGLRFRSVFLRLRLNSSKWFSLLVLTSSIYFLSASDLFTVSDSQGVDSFLRALTGLDKECIEQVVALGFEKLVTFL